MVDTSGSMSDSTGSGNNSCGQPRTKMNDAKCVLGKLVNTYGDVEFALGRFAQASCSNPCNWSNDTCDTTDGSTFDGSADRGQMLVPFGPENYAEIGEWVNFTCSNNCTTSTSGTNDPELDPGGNTPLTGYMHTARRYLQGGDLTFTTNPISTDPFSTCRPYRVILLTDGNVNCSRDLNNDGDTNDPGERETQATTVTAIKQLRKSGTAGVPEGVMPIDVRTDVIGFGISAGDSDIEAYAQAGGRPNVAGQNEGFYATDEASLALAFSKIIEGSLLVEKCNGIDDNCNGIIDEGFNIGGACDGADTDSCNEGVLVCTSPTTVGCNDPAGEHDVEVCNGLDDDCDGLVDEPPASCQACSFQPEICDNKDNNCNNQIDEGLTRPCGSSIGICTPGTETCMAGQWVGCTGTTPKAETCNNMDDDCDGVVDGFAQPCGNPAQGQCQPGQQTCQNGTFGQCIGEIGPSPEGCDGVDNDCDGVVDDNVPGLGQTCNSTCGQGTTQCVNGMVQCVGGSQGQPETCNNIDDDCNGLVDDGLPPMGPCSMLPDGQELCTPGQVECVGGAYKCVGTDIKGDEVCDCDDNDCDGQTDEGDLCGATGACIGGSHCRCAQPCDEGEFPCPVGQLCTTAADPPAGYCVPDPCYGVTCDPTPQGELTVCVKGTCEKACDITSCATGLVCRPSDGQCVPDNCIGFPDRCAADELCVDGTCTKDPCAGVDCTAPQYCKGGSCVTSCASVDCPPGERCELGTCAPSLCADKFCPENQVCDPTDGLCYQSECIGVVCTPGFACDPLTGQCVTDECYGVVCPQGQLCQKGSCYDPGQIIPPTPEPPRTYVSAAGTGCACNVGHQHRVPLGGFVLGFVAFAALLRRRGGR